MKLLTLDIEMAPNIVHRWQLWGNDSTGLNQIVQPSEMMCAAYKWYGDSEVFFMATPAYERYVSGWPLEHLHEVVNEADAVITYNGKKFDIPRLNTAFLEAKLPPPQPYAHIDLYQVCRKVFGFPSNKLDYITNKILGVGKTTHTGHDLWVACMAGDPEAWDMMKTYNKNDVVITEQLYDEIKAWIPGHPNALLYDDNPGLKACPRCGSNHYQKRGYARAATGVYQQYQCQTCKGWFRDTKRIDGSSVR